ncbi:hypothetical protein EZV62_006969 [Acer yangbiense]|uniref:Histone H2A C-terminal domain-containing protein n=1 Tax=Acer yangbiense TaxID=1000413 RepID=A0A5C7I968_9ROSI|nr:hypothetical protein EZV62_006969 [Acer yangbiense]
MRNDEELSKLLGFVMIANEGVLPNIHQTLLPKKVESERQSIVDIEEETNNDHENTYLDINDRENTCLDIEEDSINDHDNTCLAIEEDSINDHENTYLDIEEDSIDDDENNSQIRVESLSAELESARRSIDSNSNVGSPSTGNSTTYSDIEEDNSVNDQENIYISLIRTIASQIREDIMANTSNVNSSVPIETPNVNPTVGASAVNSVLVGEVPVALPTVASATPAINSFVRNMPDPVMSQYMSQGNVPMANPYMNSATNTQPIHP